MADAQSQDQAEKPTSTFSPTVRKMTSHVCVNVNLQYWDKRAHVYQNQLLWLVYGSSRVVALDACGRVRSVTSAATRSLLVSKGHLFLCLGESTCLGAASCQCRLVHCTQHPISKQFEEGCEFVRGKHVSCVLHVQLHAQSKTPVESDGFSSVQDDEADEADDDGDEDQSEDDSDFSAISQREGKGEGGADEADVEDVEDVDVEGNNRPCRKRKCYVQHGAVADMDNKKHKSHTRALEPGALLVVATEGPAAHEVLVFDDDVDVVWSRPFDQPIRKLLTFSAPDEVVLIVVLEDRVCFCGLEDGRNRAHTEFVGFEMIDVWTPYNFGVYVQPVWFILKKTTNATTTGNQSDSFTIGKFQYPGQCSTLATDADLTSGQFGECNTGHFRPFIQTPSVLYDFCDGRVKPQLVQMEKHELKRELVTARVCSPKSLRVLTGSWRTPTSCGVFLQGGLLTTVETAGVPPSLFWLTDDVAIVASEEQLILVTNKAEAAEAAK